MRIGSSVRPSQRLLLALAVAGGLLFTLLAVIAGLPVPAQGATAILRVPADYPTIQAAIDAAQAGDEIRIVGDAYPETLSITRPLTLSGGWEPDYSTLSKFYTRLNAQGLGRAITISGTGDVTVVISRFLVLNGNATGLGGVEIGSVEGSLMGAPTTTGIGTDLPLPAPAELAAQAATHLRGLAARGPLPGAQASLPASLARIERLTALAGTTPAAVGAEATGVADCGGAIYVRGASLRLVNSVIGQPDEPNIASRAGLGAGGAICAVNIPAGGMQLENVKIEHNIASDGGAGLGGGIFVSSTVEGAVQLRNFEIYNNLAGRGGDGHGGGIMLWNAPGAVLEAGVLQYNLASAAGTYGYGGGLALVASPRARLSQLEFVANSANTTWPPNQLKMVFGFGGGVSIVGSDNVVVAGDVIFDQNLAAVHGQGSGGGLYARGGQGIRVEDALFTGNWSILYPYQFQGGQSLGGGITLELTDGAEVTASTLAENQVAPFNGYCQDVYGGALAGIGVNDFQLAGSQIVDNVGGACDGGPRPVAYGAISLISGPRAITISGNTFAGNVAELGDQAGLGGALYMNDAADVMVQANQFLSNTAGSGGGVGGAVAVEGGRSLLFDGNHLVANRAASKTDAETAIGGALGINSSIDLRIVNNILAENLATQGAALLLVGGTFTPTGNVAVANNTLYANLGESGVSLRLWSTPITLTNNLVVSHSTGVAVESGAAALRYTLYSSNTQDTDGAGTIDEQHAITATPGFADAANGDFHLLPGAAAIDAGDPAGVPPAPAADIEETPRPFGPAVDIGAYEWHGTHAYLPYVEKAVQARAGWAIGDDDAGIPAIVHTVDGGQVWVRQAGSPTWVGLNAGDISAVDDRTAWAAFVSAPDEVRDAILHTTDGGATWVSQALPMGVTGGVKSIKGVSRSEAWAATLTGVVLHTIDGGSTWAIVAHPGMTMTQVNRMDVAGPHVWIADSADDGAIIHSPDGGTTWRREVMLNEGNAESPLVVQSPGGAVAWASGTKSLSFFRTLDGGYAWAKVATVGGFDHLDDVCASSAADAWGVQNGDGVSGGVHRIYAPIGGAVEHFIATPAGMAGYTPGGVSCLDGHTAWVVAQKGVPLDPAQPRGLIFFTTGGDQFIQAVAPADIAYWKISMVGAKR